MTDQPIGGIPEQDDQVSAVSDDDLFLGGLAQENGSYAGDPLGAMLAGYRADLGAETRTFTLATPAGPEPAPARPSARRRWRRRGAAGGMGVVLALSGVGAAAAASHPGQLLYPLRRSIAGPRQDRASREIARLLAEQHTGSRSPLTQAQALLSAVGDPQLRAQLQRKLTAAQRAVPASTLPDGGPRPLPPPSQVPSPGSSKASPTSSDAAPSPLPATSSQTPRPATVSASANAGQPATPGSPTPSPTPSIAPRRSPSASAAPSQSALPTPAPSTVASEKSKKPKAAPGPPQEEPTPTETDGSRTKRHSR